MLINESEYFEILDEIKARIKEAQYRAVLGANYEQIVLNWNIGKVIIEKSKWGNRFIDNLARDIKLDFPNIKGYSVRNLKYVRKFAKLVSDEEKVQTLSAQLTWSHNTYLFDKTKTLDEAFEKQNRNFRFCYHEISGTINKQNCTHCVQK